MKIEYLEKMMEEMANQPTEKLGDRQPGEYQAREIYPKRSKHEIIKIISDISFEDGEYNNPDMDTGFELFRKKILKRICEFD